MEKRAVRLTQHSGANGRSRNRRARAAEGMGFEVGCQPKFTESPMCDKACFSRVCDAVIATGPMCADFDMNAPRGRHCGDGCPDLLIARFVEFWCWTRRRFIGARMPALDCGSSGQACSAGWLSIKSSGVNSRTVSANTMYSGLQMASDMSGVACEVAAEVEQLRYVSVTSL